MSHKSGVGGTGAIGIPSSIQQLPSWLLGRAAQRGRQFARDLLSTEDVGLLELLVLASLVEDGGRSQAELVTQLQIDGSDMVAVMTKQIWHALFADQLATHKQLS